MSSVEENFDKVPGSERLPMSRTTKHIVAGAAVAALIFLVAGLVMNVVLDGESMIGKVVQVAAVVVLALEAGSMAAVAPRDGKEFRIFFMLAFGFLCLAWLLKMPLVFIEGGKESKPSLLSMLFAAARGVSAIWMVYLAVVSAVNAGYLTQLPEKAREQKILKIVFAVLTILLVVLVFTVDGSGMFSGGFVMLVLVVVGCVAKQMEWSVAVLVFGLGAFLVPMAGLPTAGYALDMLYMAAIFGLIMAMVDAKSFGTGVADWTHKVGQAIRLEESDTQLFNGDVKNPLKHERRCCEKGGNGPWYKNCSF